MQIGALLASTHPLALDTVATAMVNLPTERVWTQKVAVATGRRGVSLDELDLLGTPLAGLQTNRFRPARTTDVNFGLPTPLKNLLKNAITAQPVIGRECLLCGHCVTHCPPQAMSMSDHGVRIDYGRCIRCFCCQELCPHAAVTTRQGVLLKLSEFIHGRRGE